MLVFRRPNLAAEVTYALLEGGSACVDLRELGVDERVWRHVAYQVGVDLGRPCQVEAAGGVGKVSLTDWPANDDERAQVDQQALFDEF